MATSTSSNQGIAKPSQRRALLTGCSDGGMGAALAVALHNEGLKVYATSRNVDKMKGLTALGIETLELDVQSKDSIAACVGKLPGLDVLVNNAGAVITGPIIDVDIDEAKRLFDLNVWSHVAVTQAFMPLLVKSTDALIVNQTSCGAASPFPFLGAYCSSKSAISMISQSMRLELQPFGIKVVELRTGDVKTNLIKNQKGGDRSLLPENSIYAPARDIIDAVPDMFDGHGPTAEDWAYSVVKKFLNKNPPGQIWEGESAFMCWLGSFLPFGTLDSRLKKASGLDDVQRIIEKQNQ